MIMVDYDLDFKELGPDENLYDGIDLERNSIVDAQYMRRSGFEHNPDVCAIPRIPSAEQIMDLCTIEHPTFNIADVPNLDAYERYEGIYDMQRVMEPLGIDLDMARLINNALISSYKGRNVMESDGDWNDGPQKKMEFASNLISIKQLSAPRPGGFCVIGHSGTGKSAAVGLLTSMYPRAIRHSLNMKSYTQIPIVHITALKKQTSDVYRSIGACIDEALDTGNLHEELVTGGSITKAKGYVRKWIKKYHIGLIIIDEVQFLNLTSKGNNSVQDIIGITQETGAYFGFIGNNDAREAIISEERLLGRMCGAFLNTDTMSDNNVLLFKSALELMWEYQWTDTYTPLTDDLRALLEYESAYNIALLKSMLVKIQTEAVYRQLKTEITPAFVEDVVGDDMNYLRGLLTRDAPEDMVELETFFTKLYTRVDGLKSDECEKEKKKVLESLKAGALKKKDAMKENQVVETILNTTDDYTEIQIRRALQAAKEEDFSLRGAEVKMMVRATLKQLRSARKTQRKSKKAKNAVSETGKTDVSAKDAAVKSAVDNLKVGGSKI